ncbi:peptide-methionine (S)-S-oxide reductase [Photobacterium rosenbergii]|uniref:Peptide methionine sulfoxide reductase MsrA n=1 Tax=Photobacterium rosenbergii TaxID=294936 RepID=A0ABU3ZIR5_9GAMM|nr:peptide-methionine (S)-S-oxide reductase [Photobacterium rosenbergii]MDV5170025.1 peptide-methionine (S)-S-oxide reductase [Photobacterium rosenbergii]
MLKTLQLGFSGSCYWCMEAVFQSLDGVISAEQGWMSASNATERYEAVLVEYDPLKITVDVLVAVHLHTHHCTSDHDLRSRYPSIIYAFSETQKARAAAAVEVYQDDFHDLLLTKIEDAGEFEPCDDEKQNYFFNHPNRPFCEGQIMPKLQILLTRFGEHISADKRGVIELAREEDSTVKKGGSENPPK